MAGSLAQSGLAPELIRLVSDAVFKSDESGCGVVSMRATCASWRTALKSSEPCWRKWTEWRCPLMSANIGFLGTEARDWFKVYCTQLKAESPPRPRRAKNEAYTINALFKFDIKQQNGEEAEALCIKSLALNGDLGDGFAAFEIPVESNIVTGGRLSVAIVRKSDADVLWLVKDVEAGAPTTYGDKKAISYNTCDVYGNDEDDDYGDDAYGHPLPDFEYSYETETMRLTAPAPTAAGGVHVRTSCAVGCETAAPSPKRHSVVAARRAESKLLISKGALPAES